MPQRVINLCPSHRETSRRACNWGGVGPQESTAAPGKCRGCANSRAYLRNRSFRALRYFVSGILVKQEVSFEGHVTESRCPPRECAAARTFQGLEAGMSLRAGRGFRGGRLWRLETVAHPGLRQDVFRL